MFSSNLPQPLNSSTSSRGVETDKPVAPATLVEEDESESSEESEEEEGVEPQAEGAEPQPSAKQESDKSSQQE